MKDNFLEPVQQFDRKFLLFGTGDYYERFKKWFQKDEVVALLDNSPKKQNTEIDGFRVVSPEEGVRLNYDAIIILSFYVKEMRAQLLKLGVDNNCIFHFFDLYKMIPEERKQRKIQFYGFDGEGFGKVDSTKKSVALLSHDLTYGGPALALYHVAEVLRKEGWQVVFVSMLDGPMRDFLIEQGIPVLVDENLQVQTMKQTEWVTFFDLIFCNTIGYYVFLSERQEDIPVVWWLHDSGFFYEGVDEEVIKKIDARNLRVLSVGPVPKAVMQGFRPDFQIDNLLYGVKDVVEKYQEKQEYSKVRFVTIGYMEWRKGQDVLIDAIKLLPKSILEQCEFYLVGQNTSMLAQEIKQSCETYTQIKLTGVLGRGEVEALLENVDALICPSREDPMPTVAAEAMMHFVPCLISEATGTSYYVENNKNGLLFPCEGVLELAEKIQWCVEQRRELNAMGKMARQTYEDVFSMDAFEKKLKSYIKNQEN